MLFAISPKNGLKLMKKQHSIKMMFTNIDRDDIRSLKHSTIKY